MKTQIPKSQSIPASEQKKGSQQPPIGEVIQAYGNMVFQRKLFIQDKEIVNPKDKMLMEESFQKNPEDMMLMEESFQKNQEDNSENKLEIETKTITLDDLIKNLGITNQDVITIIDKKIKSKNQYKFNIKDDFKNYINIKLSKKTFSTHFMNVHQGSAALLTNKKEDKDKEHFLIDMGPNIWNVICNLLQKEKYTEYNKKYANVLDDINDYLKSKYIDKKDRDNNKEESLKNLELELLKVWEDMKLAYLITHPHTDHNAGSMVDSMKQQINPFSEKILQIIDPPKQNVIDKNKESKLSIVNYEKTIFIYPGDLPADLLVSKLKELQNNNENLIQNKHVVFAASHHGSETGINDGLKGILSKAESLTIIVSSGVNNIYNHPDKTFINDMQNLKKENNKGEMGTKIVDTKELEYQQGGIVVKTDGVSKPVTYKKIKEGFIKQGSYGEKSILFKQYDTMPKNPFSNIGGVFNYLACNYEKNEDFNEGCLMKLMKGQKNSEECRPRIINESFLKDFNIDDFFEKIKKEIELLFHNIEDYASDSKKIREEKTRYRLKIEEDFAYKPENVKCNRKTKKKIKKTEKKNQGL